MVIGAGVLGTDTVVSFSLILTVERLAPERHAPEDQRMTSEPARPPRPGGQGSTAAGAGLGALLAVVLNVLGILTITVDLPLPFLLPDSIVYLPLAFAAVPMIVGGYLLAAGRRRRFALGLIIGAGVVLVIGTVACFSLLWSLPGG